MTLSAASDDSGFPFFPRAHTPATGKRPQHPWELRAQSNTLRGQQGLTTLWGSVSPFEQWEVVREEHEKLFESCPFGFSDCINPL